MVILQINSVYDYGSTGKIVKKLHSELSKKGNDSFVIYGRTAALGKLNRNIKNEKNIFLISNSLEQKCDIIKSIFFDKHGLYSKKNTVDIIRKISAIKPDIIHLHNIHGFYLNYQMLFRYLKTKNIPIIWTLHDCWPYTGYCAYYDYHACDSWMKGCKNCQFRDGYPYRIFSNSEHNFTLKKDLYKDLNLTLVTPSIWLKNEVAKSILNDKKCIVINNDVNLSNFYREENNLKKEYGIENKIIYLACANIWTKQKGFAEYIKFAKELNEDEILVMIGLNPQKATKISSNILGIESLNADGLRKWYSCCDCFVNLTLEDNYPTVNLEARACGSHIVTYKTGGSPESAGPYATVVKKGDIKSVIQAARQKVYLNHFEDKIENDMAEKYLNLYQLLMNGER